MQKATLKRTQQPDDIKSGQFKVAAIGEGKCTLASYNRRDFYKISLVTKGDSRLCYGSHNAIRVDQPALVFINPMVPYAWQGEAREEEAEGYFCVFNAAFLSSGAQLTGLADLLFSAEQSPVYFLTAKQQTYLCSLFGRMRKEADNEFIYKDEFFRNHLSLIFHEAILMQSQRAEVQQPKAISRITKQFLHLLSRQFPVDLPLQPIHLKKAGDYADRLAIHVNHLNAAVQEATGKSTTEHINERLVAEARSLLLYTDYSIADIAFGLGFEYQTYFNRFFKKHTGMIPSVLRKKL